MIINSIESSLELFFNSIAKEDTIVLTTFGLDEIVLSEILKKYDISKEKRIVIFHDIMNHKNPGYISQDFINTLIFSVDLKAIVKNKCNIFHPKIWFTISPSGNIIHSILCSSFNLTSYHFSTGLKVLDSVFFSSNLAIKLQKTNIFSNINKGFGRKVIKINPVTIYINAIDKKNIIFELKEISPGKYISNILPGAEKIKYICSPFEISGRFIKSYKYFSTNPILYFNECKKKNNISLHMKFYETDKYLIAGSVNFSDQSFRGYKGNPLNTECILAMKNKNVDFVKRHCSIFKNKAIPDNKKSDDYSGFCDDKDSIDGDWIKQKDFARFTPKDIELKFDEINGYPYLSLNKVQKKVTRVKIYSKDNNNFVLDLPFKKTIRFKKQKDQVNIASLILKPPVIIEGLLSSKTIWKTQLNLGVFWGIISKGNFNSHNTDNNYHNKSDNRSTRLKDFRRISSDYLDVRDIRNELFHGNIPYDAFLLKVWLWLNKTVINNNVDDIPDWCCIFSDKLRNI